MKKKISAQFRKYLLVTTQALSLALLAATVLVYLLSARLYSSKEGNKSYDYRIASVGELRGDYYESSIYKENLKNTLNDIARYALIREQIETGGVYDGSKRINIGDFSAKSSGEKYNGPVVYYSLDDLLTWAQAGIKHNYHTFESFEQMDEYFKSNVSYVLKDNEANKDTKKNSKTDSKNKEKEDKYSDDTEERGNEVPTLDMIKESYLSIEGKSLTDYARSVDEYTLLCEVLENAANTLYEDYKVYLKYNEYFSSDNSNIKYYVFFGEGKNRKIYSNLNNYKVVDDDMLSTSFREMGEFIYINFKTMDYLTNTPMEYENVKAAFYDCDYMFYDDSAVWLGLDTEYPVKDLYFKNFYAYSHSLSILPWVISGCCVAIIAFIALLVANSSMEIKEATQLTKEGLSDFDRLPIEVELLFFLLVMSIIYISARIIFSGIDFKNVTRYNDIVLPVTILVFAATFVVVLLYLCLVRRITARNFWEKSFFAWLFRVIFLRNNFIKTLWWKLYDEAGVAVRTWATYIFFMIYNTFFACMLFFSGHPVLSFLALLVFDLFAGFYLFNRNVERKKIVDGIKRINTGEYDYQIDTRKMHGDNKSFAEAVNDIGRGLSKAVETSTKDEKLKADLITNVSHDIKTPLTSIINYVDLIKRENIDNERLNGYVKILDEKSQRLKQLTMDLVEASKVTSGNFTLELNRINFIELLNQSIGEFEEKFEEKGLELVKNVPTVPVVIMADSRRMWRIIENLFGNIYKYALENTRVYLDLNVDEEKKIMSLSLKNVSKNQLNFNADELTERFIRGDVARSTEGSGLGLSIAKSLTQAHNGEFLVYLDGDLFKITITFPLCTEE